MPLCNCISSRQRSLCVAPDGGTLPSLRKRHTVSSLRLVRTPVTG